MPVLGIIASQMSGHLFAPSGAYDSIATTTVQVHLEQHPSFTSIPALIHICKLEFIGKEPQQPHQQLECNLMAILAQTMQTICKYGEGSAVYAASNSL
jgi:hypothetical protein